MNLYQKLIEVRKAVPYLKKDNKGFQFQYVSSSQTLGALREAMDAQGVLLVPEILDHAVSDKATKKEGSQLFTELTMKFTWINAELPEERIECLWYGQGLDTGEKGTGKAATYAEKYFMLKFFNVPTDKDDPDSFQEKVDAQKPVVETPPTPVTDAHLKHLEAQIKQHGLDREAIKNYTAKYFGVEHFKEMTEEQYEALIKVVNKKIALRLKEQASKQDSIPE